MITTFNTLDVAIARAPEDVWALFLDRTRWHETFRTRELVRGTDGAPGAVSRIVSALAGKTLTRLEEIVHVSPPRRLVIRMWVDTSNVVAHGDFLFTGSAGRTALTVSIHTFLPDASAESATELQAFTQTRIAADFARLRSAAERDPVGERAD